MVVIRVKKRIVSLKELIDVDGLFLDYVELYLRTLLDYNNEITSNSIEGTSTANNPFGRCLRNSLKTDPDFLETFRDVYLESFFGSSLYLEYRLCSLLSQMNILKKNSAKPEVDHDINGDNTEGKGSDSEKSESTLGKYKDNGKIGERIVDGSDTIFKRINLSDAIIYDLQLNNNNNNNNNINNNNNNNKNNNNNNDDDDGVDDDNDGEIIFLIEIGESKDDGMFYYHVKQFNTTTAAAAVTSTTTTTTAAITNTTFTTSSCSTTTTATTRVANNVTAATSTTTTAAATISLSSKLQEIIKNRKALINIHEVKDYYNYLPRDLARPLWRFWIKVQSLLGGPWCENARREDNEYG
ncbi:hypothetical protein HELRODRAFT_172239 [Helobdella robusta]|uniref:Uncharacterized protein n=1 Tax=Helobdella robusta TaxID=6412 RepID=T1F558_HELRO|nr:hypothetical protein HELRODRAFT_172239 [Helobdella robusta]ESO04578.1 hypothetical protein HELRODRAFT_172239 [Helobdella robusta]